MDRPATAGAIVANAVCRSGQEIKPRHKTGVVSRVPCSSRSAQAFGTDRNTYQTEHTSDNELKAPPWGNSSTLKRRPVPTDRCAT